MPFGMLNALHKDLQTMLQTAHWEENIQQNPPHSEKGRKESVKLRIPFSDCLNQVRHLWLYTAHHH